MELDYQIQQKLETSLAAFFKRGTKVGRRFIIKEGRPAPYYGEGETMIIEDKKLGLLLKVDSARNPFSQGGYGYYAYIRDVKKLTNGLKDYEKPKIASDKEEHSDDDLISYYDDGRPIV